MAAVTSTVLAVGALVGTAVSAGMSYYGYQQQAKTSERIADYNAKVAENQAIQQEMEANESIRRRRREQRGFKGRQRAKFAAAGVQYEGTPLAVMAESAGLMELQNADFYRASQSRSSSLYSQASLTRQEGYARASAARMQGGISLLSGGIGLASNYNTFKHQGALR